MGREETLLDDHNSDTSAAEVLLGSEEDDGVVLDRNSSREDIGRHIGHHDRAIAIRSRSQRLGEGGELDTIDSLVVAVVDQSSILGDVPGALIRDLAILAIVDLAGIGNNVDVLRTKKSLGLLGSLLRPASSNDVIHLELLVDDISELLLHKGVVLRLVEGGDDLGLLLGHPRTNKVVHGGGELSGTATLHEENFIVLGDVEVGSKVRLGFVEDVGS